MWRELDPDEIRPLPQAPSHEAWLAMTPEERQRVVDSLPDEYIDPEAAPPEGTHHSKAKVGALSALESFFKKRGRSVFLANDLAVYYPAARPIAPDLLAVLDVETHDRTKWVVDAEGKGLDFVLEIHFGGNKKKDTEKNVRQYAQLGIPEYFIYDRNIGSLRGYRLAAPSSRMYSPIVPQHGAYHSEVLGVDLIAEVDRIRFQVDGALVLDAQELVARLDQLMGEAVARADAVEERLLESERIREEQAKLLEEETLRREEAERRAAELLAEIERLKSGRK